jgi:hypothetical protein
MTSKQIPDYTPYRKDQLIQLVEPGQFHAVYDVAGHNIVCFTRWLSTANALADSLINGMARYTVNYAGSTLPPEANQNKPWAIEWQSNLNSWVYNSNESDINDADLYRYHLIAEKGAVLDRINNRIQAYRRSVTSSLFLQAEIYDMKFREAVTILNLSEISDPSAYPFVFDYADVAGVDLRTAAAEIVLKNKLYKTCLATTEKLRLRYSKQILDCEDILTLESILSQFYLEGDIYGRV